MQFEETFEEIYRRANEERIPRYLFHKGNPFFRGDILKYGLIPKIGDSYKLFITDPSRGKNHLDADELRPMVFLYEEPFEYDSTYDDDKYKVDTDLLDKSLFRHDLLNNCYTYLSVIPPEAISLVYKGSGESAC